MSVKEAKEFFAKIAGDQELVEKVREAGTNAEEVIRLGREQGLEFTAEEMKAISDEATNRLGEGLQRFLEKVSSDEELARQIEEAGTDLDKIIRLGKENGCEFTVENLMALQELTVRSDEELSDEELESVAGGIVTALVGICAVLGAVGIAAMAVGGAAGFMIGKGHAIVAQQRS